jgi:hypothetical protein
VFGIKVTLAKLWRRKKKLSFVNFHIGTVNTSSAGNRTVRDFFISTRLLVVKEIGLFKIGIKKRNEYYEKVMEYFVIRSECGDSRTL